MAIIYSCFTCGSPDHLKSDCPNRTRRGEAPPAPRQEPGAEDRKETVASPHCLRCGVDLRSVIDHAPGCGLAPSSPERIRAILDEHGLDHSGIVRTGYRAANRLTGRTEEQLRHLAAQQAAESRTVSRPFSDGQQETEDDSQAGAA